MIKITIDPGHGGPDPGNVNAGLRESDTVLRIALRMRHYVVLMSTSKKTNIPTATVQLTRVSDAGVAVDSRAMLARRNGSALFVSLHTDSSTNKKSNGALCLVSKSGSFIEKSAEISRDILSRLEHLGIHDRGYFPDKKPHIRYNQLGVLAGTCWHMPAVLVEVATASSEHDRQILQSEKARENIAIQLAAAALQAVGIVPRLELV